MGEYQIKMGQLAEALDTYEGVGRLYEQGGFAPKAIAVYRQMREMFPHVPQASARYVHIAPKLAQLHREAGHTREAQALYIEIAQQMQHAGRDAEAIEAMRVLAELDPENALGHLGLAEAQARVRDMQGAVESYKKAAQLLMAAQRGNDAIQVFERLLAQHADLEAARTCGELYLARGRGQPDGMAALAKLQICARATPNDPQLLALVARAFDLIGDRHKAEEVRRHLQSAR
jgi:predicted Zn-dependent protease